MALRSPVAQRDVNLWRQLSAMRDTVNVVVGDREATRLKRRGGGGGHAREDEERGKEQREPRQTRRMAPRHIQANSELELSESSGP